MQSVTASEVNSLQERVNSPKHDKEFWRYVQLQMYWLFIVGFLCAIYEILLMGGVGGFLLDVEAFEEWFTERKESAEQEASGINREWDLAELMERGKSTYANFCAGCHQPEGEGSPPAFPALAGNEKLKADLEWHLNKVINGVSGAAMPAFKNTLNPVDIAAVVTYTRNAWANNTGDVVQRSEVAKKIDE